jgi:hypothetical protein
MGFTIVIGPLRSGQPKLTKVDEEDEDGPVVLDAKGFRNEMSMSYSCADAFEHQSPAHTAAWKAWRKGETSGDKTTVFLTPQMANDIFQLPTASDNTCHGHTQTLQSILKAALELFPLRKLYIHIS